MAFVEQRGKRWRGMYRDANGKRRTAGWADSKRAAKKLALDEEAKIRSGDWFDPDAGKMLFSVYFEEHWLPHRVGELNTLAKYRNHYNAALKQQFGDTELRKITTPVVQRWVAKMEKDGVTPTTIEARFLALQTVLAAKKGVSAVRDGLIAKNPCAGVTLPVVDKRPVDVYSMPEVDLLMQEIDSWWHPLVMLAADSAMRWGELMGLYVSDFSDDFARVTVSRTLVELTLADTGNGTPFMEKGRTKGRKVRAFGLSPEVAKVVRNMVKQRRLFPGDRLFSMRDPKTNNPLRTLEWPQGKPISRHNFRNRVWKPAHKAAEVRQRRFHDLRGAHISWLLAGGADVVTVMERVGHTQMSTTQLYTAPQADADQRALDALQKMRKRYRDA